MPPCHPQKYLRAKQRTWLYAAQLAKRTSCCECSRKALSRSRVRSCTRASSCRGRRAEAAFPSPRLPSPSSSA
eukprot:2703527-Pyramimonas_sp.AAC.1